jgi:hypothetical protein
MNGMLAALALIALAGPATALERSADHLGGNAGLGEASPERGDKLSSGDRDRRGGGDQSVKGTGHGHERHSERK